jgi:hypothetical protein
MKIAEALLLRKQLEAKVRQLEPIKVQGEQGIFEVATERIQVHQSETKAIDEIKVRMGKVQLAEITAEYDHYATELRKLDASIQKANWQYDVEYKENTRLNPLESPQKKK